MARLTGRYQFSVNAGSRNLSLLVEEVHGSAGFIWRPATDRDLPFLEPEIADGWRFREERNGDLEQNGKRYH